MPHHWRRRRIHSPGSRLTRGLHRHRGIVVWLAFIGLGSAVFFFQSAISDLRERFFPTPDPVVRVIYATPADREFDPAYAQAVEDSTYEVQHWFSDKLGGYSFMLEPPVPQHCTLDNPGDHYARAHGWERILKDLQHCVPVEHFSNRYVWAIFADVPYDCEHSTLGSGGDGVLIHHAEDLKGLVSAEPHSVCGFTGPPGNSAGFAHELGHAFGLPHPPGCDDGSETCDTDNRLNIMWTGWAYGLSEAYLSDAGMDAIRASPFFQYQLGE